jgi:hypothetical protein
MTKVGIGHLFSPLSNRFQNSILGVRGVDTAHPNVAVLLGSENSAQALANNYYSGFTRRDGSQGYDADPWLVEGPWVDPGNRPTPGSPLRWGVPQAIQGRYRVEYDRDWNPRDPAAPTIGPVEGR